MSSIPCSKSVLTFFNGDRLQKNKGDVGTDRVECKWFNPLKSILDKCEPNTKLSVKDLTAKTHDTFHKLCSCQVCEKPIHPQKNSSGRSHLRDNPKWNLRRAITLWAPNYYFCYSTSNVHQAPPPRIRMVEMEWKRVSLTIDKTMHDVKKGHAKSIGTHGNGGKQLDRWLSSR